MDKRLHIGNHTPMILVTGAAGFIGFHTCMRLLREGRSVLGLDNLNTYYDPQLKAARLAQLKTHQNFSFIQLDLADTSAVQSLAHDKPGISSIIHLAAQAGVRYSLENPHAYGQSNLTGHLCVLELARACPQLQHLVYASSSSVYGNSATPPFALSEKCDEPVSLYAATKRAGELMAHAYASLYGIPATGLRFFTVYGPWGRPDMAYYSFTKNIFEGTPIKVFNNGDLKRDFTYIDDIVDGIVSALTKPPAKQGATPPHRLFNLGNHRPVRLLDFINIIERTTNKKAILEMAPMAAGDVYETCADIETARDILGFEPKTKLEEGIPQFVNWYRTYHDK